VAIQRHAPVHDYRQPAAAPGELVSLVGYGDRTEPSRRLVGQRPEKPVAKRSSLFAVATALLASVAAGLPETGAEARPQWTVLTCLDTRGGLSQPADEYQQRLGAVCGRMGWALSVVRLSGAADVRSISAQVALRDGDRWNVRPPKRVASATDAIAAAASGSLDPRCGRHSLLLIVGHGVGLLDGDRPLGLDVGKLAGALESVTARHGRPIDLLALDTCYGGALEKLWELRRCTRLITASAGPVWAPGLEWDLALTTKGDATAAEVAAAVVRGGMAGGTDAAGLVSVDTARLSAIVGTLGTLCGLLGEWGRGAAPLVTYARSRAPSWGKQQELCDLRGWAAAIADGAESPELRAAAQHVVGAVDGAVVARWARGVRDAAGAAGVGVYFPPTVEPTPASYGRLAFAQDSGWYRFVQSYWDWISSVIAGDAHPG
jgi:hypothetical protein